MRYPQKAGTRGSLKWIQGYVNDEPGVLDAAIERASEGRVLGPIEWKSPRRSDEYAEYRDQAFLDLLGLRLSHRRLEDFWPRRGPQWDALGLSRSGQPVLVEAKAHAPEIMSPKTGAGPKSLKQIEDALEETARFMGCASSSAWSGTYYQYVNRLAHLYLLCELNRLDAWLVFVYFVGDQDLNGPRNDVEWRAALDLLHGTLGIPERHPLSSRVVEVFLQVPGVT